MSRGGGVLATRSGAEALIRPLYMVARRRVANAHKDGRREF